MDVSVQAYVSRLLGLVGDDDPWSILSATPARVSQLVAGADPATLARKPAASAWSINEIVAHLADSELVVAYRARTILTLNGAPIQAYDQDAWAATFDYQSCDARESAKLFEAYRSATLRVVRRVAPPLLDNHGMHAERGAESVRHLLTLAAGHDRNHLAQIERILVAASTAHMTPAPAKPVIPLDAIEKVDLRVGTIVGMDEIAGAERLMRLTVDFGAETRVVVAGIREERSDPRVLVGRQALFYYNVPRRPIHGVESQAMLCDAGFADGLLPALLQPEWPIPNGTRAG